MKGEGKSCKIDVVQSLFDENDLSVNPKDTCIHRDGEESVESESEEEDKDTNLIRVCTKKVQTEMTRILEKYNLKVLSFLFPEIISDSYCSYIALSNGHSFTEIIKWIYEKYVGKMTTSNL